MAPLNQHAVHSLPPVSFLRGFLWSLSSLLFLATVSVLIYVINYNGLPDFEKRLCTWDCGWYLDIFNNGYVLQKHDQSNVAFFPLFPFTWKFLNIGVVAISILNAQIFCIGFGWLASAGRFTRKECMLYLILGLLPFYMIPYSESFFFVGGALFLWGMTKNNPYALAAGLLISIGSRSASIIFLVAFLIIIIHELIKRPVQKNSLITAITGLICTVVFTTAVFFIHYYTTGDFFAFFHAQKYWEHEMRLPSLPLTSWGWPTHVSDSAALILGVACGFAVIQYFVLNFFQNSRIHTPFHVAAKLNMAERFTILYIAGTTAAILLFQGGNIHSLNRYVFSTPFFLYLIHLFCTQKITVRFNLVHFVIFCFLIGYIMPRQAYIEHYIQIVLAIIIIPGGLFFLHKTWNSKVTNTFIRWSPLIIGCIYQIYTFSRYLLIGGWMG